MSLALFSSPLRAAVLALASCSAAAAPPAVRELVETFLAQQAAGLPGRVEVRIADAALAQLPACAQPQVFLSPGVRAWGRVSVGLRCDAPTPWTRWVPAQVAVIGPYLVATRTVEAGQPVSEADAAPREGDLAALPPGVLTEPGELAGKLATNRIAAGAPLRRELLRGAVVIRQGQEVRVVVQGPGFTLGTEGKALSDATVGATVQVRARNGSTLSGLAQQDGTVSKSH